MAITFVEKKNKQKTLIIVLFIIVIVILFVLWQGFFRERIFVFPEETLSTVPREIKVNFETLEEMKRLRPFVKIEPFEGVLPTEEDPVGREIGRENPFLPY